MNHLLPVLALLAGLGSSISFAQANREMRWCKDEKTLPNLFIAKPAKLSGVLLDETGAPIVFEKTLVQIRDQKTNVLLLSASLDEKGQFDLGRVPAGEFRFLAVQLKDGKTLRLPLADQPKALFCSDDAECRLKVVIHFHGSDNPIDFCPPK
jgi:hypothetical protein